MFLETMVSIYIAARDHIRKDINLNNNGPDIACQKIIIKYTKIKTYFWKKNCKSLGTQPCSWYKY
jgi:hypothetical protein